MARRALAEQLKERPVFDAPRPSRTTCSCIWRARPHEVFAALFLDAQQRLIAFEELFRGTLTQTSVYPREVVTRALALNAGAVVLAHNHPSGVAEPSRADELITQALRQALALVDVRVIDHVIVGRGGSAVVCRTGAVVRAAPGRPGKRASPWGSARTRRARGVDPQGLAEQLDALKPTLAQRARDDAAERERAAEAARREQAEQEQFARGLQDDGSGAAPARQRPRGAGARGGRADTASAHRRRSASAGLVAVR